MKTPKRISLRIDSQLEFVSLAGIGIHALCRAHEMDEMTSYQVQTAAIEAINNAIIHAYACEPGHPVTIDWQLDADLLTIEVSDQGQTMTQRPPDTEPPPEAESGRGWLIMRRWMDSAEYANADGCNRVILKRKIRPSG